jgi:hypothetical protein
MQANSFLSLSLSPLTCILLIPFLWRNLTDNIKCEESQGKDELFAGSADPCNTPQWKPLGVVTACFMALFPFSILDKDSLTCHPFLF